MNRIIIWGNGQRTKACFDENLWGDNKIIAIVDNMAKCKESYGCSVISPTELIGIENYDYVVINNQYFYEIIPQICELQIPLEKIIITDNVADEPYKTCFERGKEVIPLIYEINRLVIKQMVKLNERDLYDNNSIYANSFFSEYEYKSDYFRYRTFEFIAEQIINDGVNGALAELGVFRGLFSAVISSKFPNRNIYLFDTFEGFSKDEGEKELKAGNCDAIFLQSHKDTSVEIMMSNLPYPENAIVCKGFFPESVVDSARTENFAFVSLDVDFEESTLEGLRFFYPRLSTGGFIFIHDYNTHYLKGIKDAVARYECELGFKMKKVPIADRAGTLIITK